MVQILELKIEAGIGNRIYHTVSIVTQRLETLDIWGGGSLSGGLGKGGLSAEKKGKERMQRLGREKYGNGQVLMWSMGRLEDRKED